VRGSRNSPLRTLRVWKPRNVDLAKRKAGEAAVDRYVRDGMCVGLGTGTTAYWAIQRVGAMVKAGASITAVCTSVATEALVSAMQAFRWRAARMRDGVVAIDGADEVAPDFFVDLKAPGGALLRREGGRARGRDVRRRRRRTQDRQTAGRGSAAGRDRAFTIAMGYRAEIARA